MKLYRYITGPEDATFCKRVSEALSAGWEPYGNPTLAHNPDTGSMVCGQAIIKEVDGTYSDDITLSDY